MCKALLPVFFVLCLICRPLTSAAEPPADRDRDGLSDGHEEILGTDPDSPDLFHPVLEDGLESEDRRRKDTYDATKDFLNVEFCHAGEDRYVWRVTLATKPRLADTVLHLYVDGDSDASTGREGPENSAHTGTDYMLTIAGGRGRCSQYHPDGQSTTGPRVNHVVDGNAVILSADVELGRDAGGIRYDLHVLCHTTTEPGQGTRMSDSSGKRPVASVPVLERKKIMRPGDYRENYGVAATFGHREILAVLADENTRVVPHDQLELDGFSVDHFTSRRWPHVKRDQPDGKVSTTVPRPGRYHVGFVMYDDSRDERVAIYIDGQFCGVALATLDNNRTWLYWLEQAHQFQGGERVELRGMGSGGKHGISNVVFLPQPPEIRSIEYRVENLVAKTYIDRPGYAVLSWTTTWPCPTRFEYGRDRKYGTLVEQDGRCHVHRIELEGLDPTVTYHGRPIGSDRAGRPYHGDDFTFRAAPPEIPKTMAGTHRVPLTITNPHPLAVSDWPISSGVPFPKGQLGSLEHVRLLRDGAEIPTQFEVLARWPDASIKCVLVTWLANVPASGQRVYELEYGRDVTRSAVGSPPLVQQDARGVAVDTGAMGFRIDLHGNLADFHRGSARLLQPDKSCYTAMIDAGGAQCDTLGGKAEVSVERSGPVGAVVKVLSHLKRANGEELLRIEKRVEAFRNCPWVRVRHTFTVVGSEKFTCLKQLSFRVPAVTTGQTWHVALEDGASIELPGSSRSVWQLFDDQIHTSPKQAGNVGVDAASFSRVAATGCSPGREPRDLVPNLCAEPRRGGRRPSIPSPVAPSGLELVLCQFSRGLRPGLQPVVPTGLQPAISPELQLGVPTGLLACAASQDVSEGRKGRIVGAIYADGPSGCAVAVRDGWQNYPKALTVSDEGIDIELCPSFPDGTYDGFPFEREGHRLYYSLLAGRHRLKKGMAKTHELLLCFAPPDQRRALCTLFQRPPLAAAPGQWYCGSKVFYDVASRDPAKFKLYETAIDKNLEAYVARQERQRDFGMLNYGDWYGERGTNWGNVEYDTQHAFFLEFIRSGNPAAFFLGEATELHNRDIDTVQWSEDPKQIGAVYVHQMCHVGDYYQKGVPGNLGFPRGGFTVSHAWVEGHFDHWFLTGDRRSFETGRAVADFFIRKQLGRPYDFSTCRTPGWHLIMLVAAYRATGDPYYLNAAKLVVERVLESQETQPRPLPSHQCEGRVPHQMGGWSRMMVPGHCHCEPRHRGNAGFMVAVLLSGLKYYHDLTGDERVKECMIRGAHYLLDECYSDEARGFRYTSCPHTSYRPGATPLMVEGIARAYLWTRDERLGRVLKEAVPPAAHGSSYGKGFSMYYRAGPRVLADLDAAGILLDQ